MREILRFLLAVAIVTAILVIRLPDELECGLSAHTPRPRIGGNLPSGAYAVPAPHGHPKHLTPASPAEGPGRAGSRLRTRRKCHWTATGSPHECLRLCRWCMRLRYAGGE